MIKDTNRSLFADALDPLDQVIGRVASRTAIPAKSANEATVVLVFMIPGRILPPPDFEGMRTSSYSKEHHAKQMQVAVPVDLKSPDDLRAFLVWSLGEAPPRALTALRRQRVAASVDCATEAARRVIANVDEVVEEASRTFHRT